MLKNGDSCGILFFLNFTSEMLVDTDGGISTHNNSMLSNEYKTNLTLLTMAQKPNCHKKKIKKRRKIFGKRY